MSDAPITACINEFFQGNPEAMNRIFPNIYAELRHLVKRGGGTAGETQDLVSEGLLKLTKFGGGLQFESRGHFFAYWLTVIKRLKIDEDLKRKAAKRGGGAEHIGEQFTALADEDIPDMESLLLFDQVLGKLRDHNPRWFRVIQLSALKFNTAAIADMMDIEPRTVRSYRAAARTFIEDYLGDPET